MRDCFFEAPLADEAPWTNTVRYDVDTNRLVIGHGWLLNSFARSLGRCLFGCNHAAAHDPHHQSAEGIAGFQRGQSDMRGQRLIPSLRCEHGTLKSAGDPASDDMGAAQIGLREGNQYAALFVACGEVDI